MKVRLRVPAVDDPDFLIEMSHGEIAVVRLTGSADTATADQLAELIDTLHQELVDRATPELVVDLRPLDHMSASCLKALMRWFAAADQRYRVRVRINSALGWQHSLNALACFDTNTISIET